MNVAATFLGVAAIVGVLAALVAALPVEAGARSAISGAGTALSGVAGAVAGVAAMTGAPVTVEVSWLLPLSGVTIALDALGGVFVTVAGGVAVAAGVYGMSNPRSRAVQAVLPLFVVAMVLVPAAGSVTTFLVCWQLVVLTSLLLVVAEHGRQPSVAAAGRWYAVLAQLGFLAVLIGLFAFAGPVGSDTFAALRDASPGPAAAGLVFVLTLAGFAAQAGIVPLHVWLPRAQPHAPSEVSALMSAAMVALGGYGIVRVGFDLLGGGPAWWWLLVLAAGAASAVYGSLRAVASTDLKRLLAHTTTQHMGLVLIGIGAAGLFSGVLAGLALAAALLHVLGHAAFQSLLFLSAGSVTHATGSRDLDTLGGLRRGMPGTTALFGLGALAASALPLGTAFVSVWLLLQALIHGLPGRDVAVAVAIPVAVAAVALSVGVGVAALVKAFGVGFLARPRSAAAAGAKESQKSMLAGMAVAGVGCVVLALVPAVVLPALGNATEIAVGGGTRVAGLVTMRLAGVTGALSPLLLTAALVVALVLVLGLVRVIAGRRDRRPARLWSGGGGPVSARMEYNATSFAQPLQRIADGRADGIERRYYEPVLAALAGWGRAGSRLAGGSVHRYLGYGFYTVCGLLVLLVVTR